MPPIYRFVGPPGCGKTTLCRLFLDMLPDLSVLAVDASRDGYLALSYGVEGPMTVAELLGKMADAHFSRESMDWALQDLPVPVASEAEADVLPWGIMPEKLTATQISLLSYGLPRLLRGYKLILWDGPIGIPRPDFDFGSIRPFIVVRPEDEDYCQKIAAEGIGPAWLLLSKANPTDSLPRTAVAEIQAGNWTFIGRVPALDPPEKRIRELPEYFRECFQKLDLPFDWRQPSSSQ